MLILNRREDCLGLAWTVCPLPRFQDRAAQPLSLHLCIKGTFNLVPGGPAVPVSEDPEFASGDIPNASGAGLGLGYSSDFVAIKPAGEFLIQGSAHPPKPSRDGVFTATCTVGNVSKSILVHGERKWERSLMGSRPGLAAVATPVPLSYACSYGGSGACQNPIGKGFDGVELHRIDSPIAPVHRPGVSVQPAGFGPLPMEWPQRMAHFGECDADYVANHWPWWPEGFNWRYFQSAPLDQCTTGYWRGDEAMRFQNLHSEIPDYQCQLPGLRARCFAKRKPISTGDSMVKDVAGAKFFEVEMVLDTIWVNPESGKLILCWRGHIPVATIKFPDLQSLWMTLEPLGENADLAPIAFADLDQMEAPPAPNIETVSPPTADSPDPEAGAKAEAKRLEAERTQIEEAVAKARAAQPQDPRSVEEIKEIEAQLKAFEERMQVMTKKPRYAQKIEEAGKQYAGGITPEDPTASIAATANHIAELEKKFADLEAMLPGAPTWRKFDRDGLLDIDAMRELGLEGADCRNAPFAGLDLSGINFGGAVFAGTDLTGTKLCRTNLAGADFSECNLSETDFSGAVLDFARFEGNTFGGTRFDGALCGDVRFLKLDLRNVTLVGLQAPRASFEQCVLAGMDFTDALLVAAEFPGCNLAGTNFVGSMLSGADFRGAIAPDAKFSGCHLENLRADDTTNFAGAKFDRGLAQGIILEGCDLTGADFSRADLQNARLVEVKADGATFCKADLRKATFEDSRFVGGNFEDANAMQVTFDRSNCRAARFHRANLFDSSFWETDLSEARWDDAFIPRTRLAVGAR